MYLVVIAWMYVVLMMSVAEAFGPQGTVLGALVTLVLYGLLPLSIVVYILGTPARKRALRAQQASAPEGNADGHAASAAPTTGVAPVREKDAGL